MRRFWASIAVLLAAVLVVTTFPTFGTVATKRPVTASGVATGNGVIVDSINGNDATGNRLTGMPFLTLSAAKSAATAGDTIIVRPGNYVGNNLNKGGVNWEFQGVGKVSYAPADFEDPSWSIWDDRPSGAVTNIIKAAGWTFIVTNIAEASSMNGVFVQTNPLSRVEFTFDKCQLLRGGVGTAENLKAAIIIANHGFLILNGEEISNAAYPSSSSVYGIYWELGDLHATVKRFRTENSAIWGNELPANTTGYDTWLRTDSIEQNGGGDSAIYLSGVNSFYKLWVYPMQVRTTNNAFGAIAVVNGGKLYVKSAGNIRVDSDPGLTPDRGCVAELTGTAPFLWLSAQKVVSTRTWLFITNSGTAILNVNQYEHQQWGAGGAGASAKPGFHISGGTVTIDGGKARATNTTGIKALGTIAEARFNNFTLTTVNTSGAGNTNCPADVQTNGVIFQNSALYAPASVDSVRITNNSLNMVTIEGTLEVNTAPSSGAVFTNGILSVVGNSLALRDAGMTLSVPSTATNSLLVLQQTSGNVPFRVESNGLHTFYGFANALGTLNLYPNNSAGAFTVLTNFSNFRTNQFRSGDTNDFRALTNLVAGLYEVGATLGFGSSNANLVRLEIFTNNVAANVYGTSAGGGNSIGQVTAIGLLALPANCSITAKFTCTLSANHLTNHQAALWAKQL